MFPFVSEERKNAAIKHKKNAGKNFSVFFKYLGRDLNPYILADTGF